MSILLAPSPAAPAEPPAHPVLAFAQAVEAGLKDVAGVDPVFMSTRDKAAALVRLSRLESQLTALRLRVQAAADDVAEADAARDTAAWLAHQTRNDSAPCRADQQLARATYGPAAAWPTVGAALTAGDLTLAQVRVITRALDALPDSVEPDVLAQAEAHLVEQAADFTPRDLRILGRRVLDVIAPEVAEAEEARQLAAEEAHARAHTSLRLRPLGDGTTHLVGRIPDATATRLSTYLHAYTSPRQGNGRDNPAATTADADGAQVGAVTAAAERIPYDRQLGQAFCALLEDLDPDRLPLHGGDATTVVVTMTVDQLTQGLREAGPADLADGTRITASEARRLACAARLIPSVLGGDSLPLDLGRSRRLFNAAQRKALRLRDRQCRGEGCTVPATWCEAHHLTAWTGGGKTDLADGVLLCTHHHHRAHDPAYTTERLPNGDLRYHRRT